MSNRPVAAANLTASQARHATVINFLRLDFTSGVITVCDAPGFDVGFTHPDHGALTYEGIGGLGGIAGTIKETARVTENPARYQLNAIDTALISQLRTEAYYGRSLEHRVGFLDETAALLAVPDIEFDGVMDSAVYDSSAGSVTLTITAREAGAEIRDASGWLMTDEHQQRLYPGDLYFQYLWRMMDLELEWFNRAYRPPVFNPSNQPPPLPDFNFNF